ncbi:7337_t:CDS:2 [Gigaspora margarita]|uniref:7337_t:CDS:1 n=1 Tax=Gigaspora margarita TaxID=4874 RepID=A0ABN7UT12_GIGMA|nr:7337_t:CDS:2 [Gigaspora margarita]
MSSIFIAFCFVKTTSGNDKFTTGTALYRANAEDDEFREFTYKGFTGNTDSLIIEFEKDSIVLMTGRYIYHENAEYLGLIQTIPVTSTSDSPCSSKDLPNAFPLLLYTAPVVTNSYKFNNNIERESFMLSKKLYNPVNRQKGIDSNVIVSYSNANDSLKKSVILAIGRLKLNPISKFPHIISSEIEKSYASIELKSSPLSATEKIKFTKQINTQLDFIEEQYTTMTSQDSNKRRRTGLFASSTKNSNNNPLTVDLPDLVNQIRTNVPEPQPSQESSANRAQPQQTSK